MSNKKSELEQAYEYCRNNEFDKAFLIALKLAEQGDVDGQALVGRLFCEGLGTVAELQTGIEWLEKAAAKLDKSATQYLFNHYAHNGMDTDVLRVLYPLAASGDSWAKFEYGNFLFHAKQNYPEGLKWMDELAIQGNIQAMFQLAFWYSKEVDYGIQNQNLSSQWKKKAFEETERTLELRYVPQLLAAYLFGVKDIDFAVNKERAFQIASDVIQKNVSYPPESEFEMSQTKLYLARMFQNGWGTTKDAEQAELLFKELDTIQYVEFDVGYCRTHPGATDHELNNALIKTAVFNTDDENDPDENQTTH